ncbi:hypothetical protein ADIS_3021 [Lunatimonas lonarensis]|uniref:Uncharacterized protein n=1 Tax=Lunatimonas lonarensis TaxID=1232681 RepID=R7ZR23_9BACT|nr:hypothetical protein ADIS_3021 [Lunatimonas lonarensis]
MDDAFKGIWVWVIDVLLQVNITNFVIKPDQSNGAIER